VPHDDFDEVPEEGSMIYMQMPPEVREMIEHQKMHAEANGHQALDFLNGLSEDQLKTFRGIVSGIGAIPDSVPYYIGLVGGLLYQKFNICLACGKNHDKDLADLTGDGPAQAEPTPPDYSLEDIGFQLAAYEVEFEIDNATSGPVLCLGPCKDAGGTRGRWDSLEQRMERKAGTGGCDFCANIAKFG
jgi:hypothetical protein